MADLWIADLGGHMAQQRRLGTEQIAGLEGTMAGERTDGDMIAAIVDIAQVIEAADVDQHPRGWRAETA